MTTSWLALFDDVNRILRSVGPLFEDCDRLLHKCGFVPSHGQGNRVERESRSSILKPWFWYPGWFVRQYKKEKGRSANVLYIAVFLHDCGGKVDYCTKSSRIDEPIVTGGVIRYNKGRRWNHWHCKTWFWSTDGVLGGGEAKSEIVDSSGRDYGQAVSFAVRLINIHSAQDVDTQIIRPLVKIARRLEDVKS